MKRLLIAAGLLLALATTGCTSVSQAGYYWGNYPSTLYALQRDPSDETLAAHVEELNKIVAYSTEKGLKTAPGILAELGYIEQSKGNSKAALGYYESEVNAYPESRIFLERLTAGLQNDTEDEK